MRRRRSSAILRLAAACCVLLGATRRAAAQSSPQEGGVDLLLPTGARSLGMGQAVAASAVGSDALWWNPALIARGPREFSLNLTRNSSLIAETDATGAFIFPVNRIGAFALSFRYINYGSQVAQLDPSGQVGTFYSTATIAGVSFAPILTNRLSGGITYKLLRLESSCTGTCSSSTEPTPTPQGPALDFGLAYLLRSDSTLSIGASARNLGPKLQVNDTPQADPLPGRVEVGIAYSPKFSQLPPQARVRLATDVVSSTNANEGLGFRIGGELSWQERYQARVGYVANGPTGSGPTFGFGIRTGSLQIDLAQMLSDIQSQSGVTPTFLTLRVIF